MPKRSLSHKIGSRACAAVAGIFNELGWAAESVKEDYGEDLLVQPAFREELEHFRLWVQVKGTSSMDRLTSDGCACVSVPGATAMRWARSADPVLFVVWDVSSGSGCADWAPNTVDDWNAFDRPVSVRIAREKTFDTYSALRFGREAFLRHYARLFAEANADEQVFAKLAPDEAESAKKRRGAFAQEVLHQVGILQTGSDFVAPRFMTLLANVHEMSRQLDDALCALAMTYWIELEWQVELPIHVAIGCLPVITTRAASESLVGAGVLCHGLDGRYVVAVGAAERAKGA